MTDREARLDALRDEAARRGADGATGTGYYDQPLLKPPVWTWEVPAYFFVGGVAGVAAMVAAVSAVAGADLTLVRDARWIAAAGAVISPALLISDLGRPDRFIYMLRVFKWRSPMSVGAWTLALFSPAVLPPLALDAARSRHDHELAVAGDGRVGCRRHVDGPRARDLHRRAAGRHGDSGLVRPRARAAGAFRRLVARRGGVRRSSCAATSRPR